MRVAGFQMAVNDSSVRENQQKIFGALEQASAERADILLTPEGSLSGYHNRFDPQEVRKAVEAVCQQAKKLGVGLALGTCYVEEDGRCYNQLRFYEKDGRYLGAHAKTLLCSNSLDWPYSGEITCFTSKRLEVFTFQGVVVGGLICNDLWANPACTPMPDPHLTHQLARKGAKIIFHAINGGRGVPHSIALNRAFHEANQCIRAMADGLYIVSVDNAYPLTKDNSCSSGVISPQGKHITRLPTQGEHLFVQDLA